MHPDQGRELETKLSRPVKGRPSPIEASPTIPDVVKIVVEPSVKVDSTVTGDKTRVRTGAHRTVLRRFGGALPAEETEVGRTEEEIRMLENGLHKQLQLMQDSSDGQNAVFEEAHAEFDRLLGVLFEKAEKIAILPMGRIGSIVVKMLDCTGRRLESRGQAKVLMYPKKELPRVEEAKFQGRIDQIKDAFKHWFEAKGIEVNDRDYEDVVVFRDLIKPIAVIHGPMLVLFDKFQTLREAFKKGDRVLLEYMVDVIDQQLDAVLSAHNALQKRTLTPSEEALRELEQGVAVSVRGLTREIRMAFGREKRGSSATAIAA